MEVTALLTDCGRWGFLGINTGRLWMNNIIREGIKSLLLDARKHSLPMPDDGNNNPYPKDIDEHVEQELVAFYTWLVQKYWDEHT